MALYVVTYSHMFLHIGICGREREHHFCVEIYKF